MKSVEPEPEVVEEEVPPTAKAEEPEAVPEESVEDVAKK